MKLKQQGRKARFWQRSIAMASMLWLGLSAPSAPSPLAQSADAETLTERKRNSAYVFDRPGTVFPEETGYLLDQLNFSFGLIKDGRVNGDHWHSIEAYKTFIADNPHILPVLSVGGWAADGFSQAAATEEGRQLFVSSALELMEKHGFRGIDIDWEYPGSSVGGIASSKDDRENYTLLLRALRAGLDELTSKDGHPRMLAIAVGAVPSLIQNMDCKAIGEIVDQVNLMTYDIQTPNVASHHTALFGTKDYPDSADHAVKAFSEAGIPKDKLMIGVAFYGRMFKLSDRSNGTVFSKAEDNGADTAAYKDLSKKLEGAVKNFDEHAKAPYAVNGKTFITYDDPTSIHYKGAYVKENGLMGLMCWEYSGDPGGELLEAMFNSLN